uniref:Innexin n=1 Tax=Panagrolaimus davidi TaxID=227884 RepID=A0A914PFB8_9BILA
MFNELMYILLWFWFTFLAVTNLISAIYWIITSFSKKFRYMCIKDMLEYSYASKVQQSTIEEFIESRIFWDGLLALRLLAINVGDRVTSGIVVAMFNDFVEEKEAAENESKKKTGNNINWKSITLAKGNDGTNNSNDSGFDGGNGGTNDSGFDGGNNNDNENVDAMILKKVKNFDENTMIKCLRDFDNSNYGNPYSSEEENSVEFLKFLQTWNPKSANSSSSSDISSESSDYFYDEESLLRPRKLQQMLISLDKETFQKIFKRYKRFNGDSDDDVEFHTVYDLYGMIYHMGPIIEEEYEKFVYRQKVAAAQKRVVQRKMPTVNDEKDKNLFYEDDQPSQSTFFTSKALSNPSKPPGIPAYRNPFVDPPSESEKIVSEPVKSVAPEVPKRSPFKAPSNKPVSSAGGLSTKNDDENRSPKTEKRVPTFDELLNKRVVSATTPEILKLPTFENSSIILPDGGLGTKNGDENHSPKIVKHVPIFDNLMNERIVSAAAAPEVPKPSSNKPVTTSDNVDAKNLKVSVTDETHSPKAEKRVPTFDEFMKERVVPAAPEISKLSSFEESSISPVLPDDGLGTKNADENRSPKIEKRVPTFDELMNQRVVSTSDVATGVPKPSSNKPVLPDGGYGTKNADAKNLKATVTDETHSPKAEKHVPTSDEFMNEGIVSAAPEILKLPTFEDSSTTPVLPDGGHGTKNADENRSPKIEKRVPTFDELMNQLVVSASDVATGVPKPSSNKPVLPDGGHGTKNADAKNLKATVTDETHSPKAEKRVQTFNELLNGRVVSVAAAAAPEIPKLPTFEESSISPVLPDGGLGTKNADETHSPKAEKHVPTFDKSKKDRVVSAAVAPEVPKPSSNKHVLPDDGLGTKNADENRSPKIGKLVEVESMNVSVPVTATSEAFPILISDVSSIQPENFGMKNVDETVLPGLTFDHLNLPAELQTFVDLDEPDPMPKEAFIREDEVLLPTPNLNNFDDETADQKPVAEIEAAVGFPGAGIWQGFKNMANSLFGTYAPVPPEPEDASFENDEIVDSIDDDFSINEKFGIDKNEQFDNQQHEKYDNHETEADETFINSIVNDISHSAISDTDKSVDSGFINQDTMIIPDNNYEALESAKLGVVEKTTVPSQSASDTHFASDAAKIVDVDKSVVRNIFDKPPMKSADLSAIDFDSNPEVIDAALKNVVSYFDTIDTMPISPTNEIHVPVDSPKP